MNDEALVIDPSPDQAFNLEKTRMALNAGLLGKFFGTGPNVPLYIAGLTIAIFSAGALLVLFIETKMPAAEYLKWAAPIISGALGFVFGRKG